MKILKMKIERCGDCPNIEFMPTLCGVGDWRCKILNDRVTPNTIPLLCPLEDDIMNTVTLMMRHPVQPIGEDLRFKSNAIVTYLLDSGTIDLNHIASMNFSIEDRQQFAQLIGYSLSGYSELSYVDDYAYGVAWAMWENQCNETEARIEYLEKELEALRNALRIPIARLYEMHPDHLGVSV